MPTVIVQLMLLCTQSERFCWLDFQAAERKKQEGQKKQEEKEEEMEEEKAMN